MLNSEGSCSDQSLLAAEAVEYRLKSRGSWTTIEYQLWPGFSLGQTTAETADLGGRFDRPQLLNRLLENFLCSEYHQAEQIHNSVVNQVAGPSACHLGVDGLVTDQPGLALLIKTADCLPVFIKNSKDTRWALVHAGWRGLCQNIVPRVLEDFFPKSDLVEILVGPGISSENYRVGGELIGRVLELAGCSFDRLLELQIFHQKETEIFFDLIKFLRYQLSGFSEKIRKFYIFPGSTGTTGEIPLFSYRMSKTKERNISWIFKEEG